MRCRVWWSIYVRTGSIQKLKEKHLPLISQALEPTQFPWDISLEELNLGLVRIETFQNYEANTVDGLVLPVLKRAYRLANGWKFSGLGDLEHGELRHVIGNWDSHKPNHQLPAVESIMIEMEPGSISHISKDGGWMRSD